MNKKELDIIIKGAITQECLEFLKSEAQKQRTICNNIDEVMVKGIPVKDYLEICKKYLDKHMEKSLEPYIKRIEPIKVWETKNVPETISDHIKLINEIIENIEREIAYLSSVLEVLASSNNQE